MTSCSIVSELIKLEEEEKQEKLRNAIHGFYDAFLDLSNAYLYKLGADATARVVKMQ